MEPKYLSHRITTVVRDEFDVPRFYISTSYCREGFSGFDPEWETMVFRYEAGEVNYLDELEQFRDKTQKQALINHAWCIERYTM